MTALVRYDAMCSAIADAYEVDEVKDIRDKAMAIALYARQAKNFEAARRAEEIRVRAERRAGQLTKEMPKIIGDIQSSHNATTEPKQKALLNIGISKQAASEWERLAAVPEAEFEALVSASDMPSARAIIKESEKAARDREHAAYVAEKMASAKPVSDRFSVRKLPCLSALDLAPESIDWIVTDPPYAREFLPVYGDLGKVAAHVLKPGGSLLCMTGHSHLGEVINWISPYLGYHWIIAYFMPGQSAQIFGRRVNVFWKPVLWFTSGKYESDWIGDVVRSDASDKRFHQWGQSESGMRDLMRRFVRPGDVVLDPFMGAATTGVIALELGATFIGFDSDENAFNEAVVRLGDAPIQ